MNERSKRIKRMRLTLIILIILFTLLSFEFISKILILISFIVFNFVFAFVKKKIPKLNMGRYFYGIEIIMICTIVTSVTFGPKIGAVMGGLLMLVNYIAERRPSQFFLVTIILYFLIGYFAWFYRAYDIVKLGIISTILYNIASFLLVSLLGANKKTVLIFAVVNICFNTLLFTSFAPSLLALIT